MEPILSIQGLHRRYGRNEALRGINFVIRKPGVYGFLGPNGAGKTTTIKIVAGLLRPTSGRVLIQGIDVQADPVASREHLGVMMESATFYNYLSGRDNLRVLARLSGHEDIRTIDSLLDRVGLGGKADQTAGSYSRGMRQRLGLAAALLGNPQLVILDEPTNGLDPSGIAEMRKWLVELAEQDGMAVLLSSHQMEEVERICNRVAIIDRGILIADGPTNEIVQPRNTIIVRTDKASDAQRVLKAQAGIRFVEQVDLQTLRVDATLVTSSSILRLLADEQIDVREVIEERETLEDAFFRLVGERRDVA